MVKKQLGELFCMSLPVDPDDAFMMLVSSMEAGKRTLPVDGEAVVEQEELDAVVDAD